MNTGLVGKGVGADDRLVRLHGKAGDTGNHFRTVHDLRGIEAGFAGKDILAGANRHDDLLERRITGAFAEAVNGAFDLARAVQNGFQRVGHGEPEVVVAMHREHRLVGVRNTFDQVPNQRTELVRHVVADRIRNVDRGRALGDHRLDHAAQEVGLGAAGVLG